MDKIEDFFDEPKLTPEQLEEQRKNEEEETQKEYEQEQKELEEQQILQAIEDGTYYDEEQLRHDYEEQCLADREQEQKEFQEFEKKKEITFDDIVNKFAPALVGLKGESYNSATKMIFYSVLANQIKNNYFYADGKKIDLRIPLLIMIKAGHGKKSYENFIKITTQGLGKDYSEPTSYHPEQFIGKVEKSKDDDFCTQIHGYFHSDYIIIDEAYELLTSEKDEEKTTLKYIRTALDPIGNNEIEKKQVGIAHEDRLHYFPTCTISLMTQPIADVNEELLTRGSFRRFVIVTVDTPLEERMTARREAEFLVNKEETNAKRLESWIKSNKKLATLKLKFIGDKKDFSMIDDYIDKILKALKMDSSFEALEFTNSIQYNIKFLIFKMAIVRAVVEQMRDNINIDKRHIEKAIQDFDITWQPQVNWIRRKMTIVSDKPKEWKEVHAWIYENLLIAARLQQDIVNKWADKNAGVYKETTLREYAKRAIKDMKKWGYISETPTGDKNNKLLKLIEGKKI